MSRRVALVTGGGRGIGLGVSQALAAAGFDLVICGVREESAVAEVMRALAASGAAVHYVQADVSKADDRTKLIAAVRARFRRLDVLVNNAGVAPSVRADIMDAGEESFDRLIAINLKGPYFLTQLAANWMREERQADQAFAGCIINVSSISATVASVNRGDYCISKAGVGMATQLWASRLAEFGVNVYEVRPGIIKTDMTAGVVEKYDKLIAGGLLLQPRWGSPEDVGKAVAMLARGDLPYSTGQVLMVDGGLTAQRL
ncbi:MAG: 3-ketoacyl-ACP reductase [Planctomycetes bacterium]|nr:3-ketoacyl-ACP reductase [Planctomycetota bacterium]